MDPRAFRILDQKRRGESLSAGEIDLFVKAAATGEWEDAEVAAWLMAAAIRGLDAAETRQLTLSMLRSGEQWNLAAEIPNVGDKHSTGGVGDKVSLVLAPLLAACDRPIVMLTGRGLGHTGGTADKLEAIPGVDLALDRARCLHALRVSGLAIGIATGNIAPADKRLYALRDRTATIASVQLIAGSILSKKLATGASAIVFDVKTGDGAFLPVYENSLELARLLVATTEGLGRKASALVTDMSQPLGRWVGHTAEVRETLETLAGDGPDDLVEITLLQAEELATLTGAPLSRAELRSAIDSGRARERFDRWAVDQGADPAWMASPDLGMAPEEVVLEATEGGRLSRVANRRLGELLVEAGGGRHRPGEPIDFGVSLLSVARLGDAVEPGDELARLYLRRRDPRLEAAFADCFEVGLEGTAPPLLRGRVAGTYAT